jgi:hypothetical protein
MLCVLHNDAKLFLPKSGLLQRRDRLFGTGSFAEQRYHQLFLTCGKWSLRHSHGEPPCFNSCLQRKERTAQGIIERTRNKEQGTGNRE